MNKPVKRVRKTRLSPTAANETSGETPGKRQCLQPEESRCGIIEKVYLENFMCHKKLLVHFGPNINFVMGRNGSGKSAILTAVVVGLGGSARATDRGNTLQNLIKKGETSAQVHITLNNRGPASWKRHDYGDLITIVRILKASSGGYKIKNAVGHVVSQKREEVMKIVNHFCIDVENPISILNQEVSKNFLNATDPRDKYRFFLKATLLEKIQANLNDSHQLMKQAEEILKQKECLLPGLERKAELWKIKLRAIESWEAMKEKLVHLEYEKLWAECMSESKPRLVVHAQWDMPIFSQATLEHLVKIEAMESSFQEEEASLEKHKKVKEQALKKLQTQTQLVDSYENQKQSLQEKLREYEAKIQDLQPKQREAENDVQTLSREIQKLMADHRTVMERVEEQQKDLDRLSREEERLQCGEEEALKEKERQKVKLAQLKQNGDALQAQIDTTCHHKEQLSMAAHKLSEKAHDLLQQEHDLQRKIDDQKRAIRSLEAKESGELSLYGQWMPELVRCIEEADQKGKFTCKPVGPIGAYVKVKEDRFLPLVESILGRALRGFCINHEKDINVLKAIMDRVVPKNVCRPTISVTGFQDQFYDVSKMRVMDTRHPTLLDVLEITNPVAGNYIIDLLRPENTLIVPNGEAARALTSHRTAVPKNLERVFTLDGNLFFPDPAYRSYSHNIPRPEILSVDIKEAVRYKREELRELEGRRQVLRRDLDASQMEVQAQNREVSATELQLRNLRRELGRIQMEISNVDMQPHRSQSCSLTAIQEEIDGTKAKLNELRQRQEVSQKTLMEKKGELARVRCVLSEFKIELKDLQETHMAPIKAEMDALEERMNQSDDGLKHWKSQLQRAEKAVQDAEKELKEYRTRIDAQIKETSKTVSRIRTRRTVAAIENEMVGVERQLKASQETMEPEDVVRTQCTEISKRFQQFRSSLSRCRLLITRLSDMLKMRREVFSQCKLLMGSKLNTHFAYFLQFRHQYEGTVEFDHEKGLVLIRATTAETEKMYKESRSSQPLKREVGSLSGGERSFFTTCFLMASWLCIDSPFRMLDEFDVFMDMVNRRVVIQLLLNLAQKYRDKQYVFLTPLDLSIVGENPLITIHQLAAPKRKREDRDDEDDGMANGSHV